MPKKGVNSFNDSCLTEDRFENWLLKVPSTNAKCKWCGTTLDVRNMEVASLANHAKYKKHEGKEHCFNNLKSAMSPLFFSRSSSSLTLSSSSQSSQVQSAVASNTLDSMILPIIILDAEIKWSVNVVQNHLSFRSCIDLNKLFYHMFPDSKIAQKSQLEKTKCAYLVNYGMKPFVKDQLLKNIVVSMFYTVSFDESMNRVLQYEQIDVQVC